MRKLCVYVWSGDREREREKQDGKLFLDPSLDQRPFSFPYLNLCLDPSVICLFQGLCTASQLYPYLILYLTSLAICGLRLGWIIMQVRKPGTDVYLHWSVWYSN